MDRELFIKAVTRLQTLVGHHKGVVRFSRNEYDYQEDFPHVYLNEQRIDICEVRMTARTNDIVLVFDKKNQYENLVIDKESYNPEQAEGLDPESLYILFEDIFYNLPESFQYDDFESFVNGEN